MSRYTTQQILEMIELNKGPVELNLSDKDLGGIDLSRDIIQAELEKVREKDPGAEPEWLNPMGGIELQRVNLRYATLWEANLRGASLLWAKLQGACLKKANLRETNLWYANLEGAYLGYADLTRVDFLGVESIKDICLYRAVLDHTQLTSDQLGEAVGEELKGKWFEAKEAYLALKNNFEQIGRYDDASWAYRKKRRMEKREAHQKAKEAFRERHWRGVLSNSLKVARDQFVELVCDYGESICRVLLTLLALWLIFAFIYGFIAGVWGQWQETSIGKVRYITRNYCDLLSFSLGVMTTLIPAGLEARPTLCMRFLMPLQAMLGVVLTGLLGFVLGNRIQRS